MSKENEFNPDWKLTPVEYMAVKLSIALGKHVPDWPGATDEQLKSVATDIFPDDEIKRLRCEIDDWRALVAGVIDGIYGGRTLSVTYDNVKSKYDRREMNNES